MYISLVLRSPELDTVLQIQPHQCWLEGKDFPPLAGNGASLHSYPVKPRILSSLQQRHIADSCSTSCPSGSPDHFIQSCFLTVWPTACPDTLLIHYWYWYKVVTPLGQDFKILLLELHELPLAPFLQHVEVPLGFGSLPALCNPQTFRVYTQRFRNQCFILCKCQQNWKVIPEFRTYIFRTYIIVYDFVSLKVNIILNFVCNCYFAFILSVNINFNVMMAPVRLGAAIYLHIHHN